jgi:hypothetical protein
MTDVTLIIRRSGALDGPCIPSPVRVHATSRSVCGQLPSATLQALCSEPRPVRIFVHRRRSVVDGIPDNTVAFNPRMVAEVCGSTSLRSPLTSTLLVFATYAMLVVMAH